MSGGNRIIVYSKRCVLGYEIGFEKLGPER